MTTTILCFFLFLFLSLSSFNVYCDRASETKQDISSRDNPFTAKASLIRYWNTHVSSDLPKPPPFLLSKASPLNAVDLAKLTKVATGNSLSSNLDAFCSLANLICSFDSQSDAFKRTSQDANFAVKMELVTVKTSPAMLKTVTLSNENFTSYGPGANGGSGQFTSYADRVNVPNLRFTSYDSDDNNHKLKFTSYSDETNSGAETFISYGKNGNTGPTEFTGYGVNANTVGSGFTGYGESGNAPNDTFTSYGDSGNNPHNTFRSYGFGSNSGVSSFSSYRDTANVGDDSFQSYAKNTNSGKANFANYGKTFNLGNDTFKEYGIGSKGLTKVGFKSYGLARSFKGYAKNVATFAGYSNTGASSRQSSNFEKRWVEPGKFFREAMLKQGNVMVMPDIRDKMPKRSFLPRPILSKLPFSTSELPQLKELFNVKDNSSTEVVIVNSLAECERAPSQGETKRCVGSMEDMIDFATSVLGQNVVARTTECVNGSKQRVMMGSVRGINNGKVTKSVSCHQSLYPYLLYYCHSVPKVRVYKADILDVESKMKINHGVAICHIDTSAWSPTHGAFVALGSTPGQIEVCHWIFENDLTWTIAD
ncbi:hypothetical protein Patl1_18017 [Pistacia atlantica]|uniref:Uncharacterized protein n=1 Tax=Pistacia atlantica TaxID=434234 RepID=A0ACC1BY82_9ROSI|nr:hypothetical protein Patl1_18017 [Pistacia atlantica]